VGAAARAAAGPGLYKRIWLKPAVDFAALGIVLVVLEPQPQSPGPGEAKR
jgi:hypothetical protein